MGCSSLLYHPSNRVFVEPQRLGLHAEDIYFASGDNVQLHAWLLEPKKVKYPWVFVLFHGNAENLTSHYTGMSWVVEAGARLFAFDYQGYGRSQGRPSPEGTVRDGIAAITWVQKKFPSLKVIVVAQSLGGPIALRSLQDLSRQKDFYPPQAIILEGTFLSYQQAGASVLSRSVVTWLFQPFSYLLLSDRWGPERGEPLQKSKGLLVPKIVIHNEKDPVVAYSLGQSLYSELPEPKEFWSIPPGHHMDTFWRKDPDYRKKLLDFLRAQGS